jgi:hypothetical protein
MVACATGSVVRQAPRPITESDRSSDTVLRLSCRTPNIHGPEALASQGLSATRHKVL